MFLFSFDFAYDPVTYDPVKTSSLESETDAKEQTNKKAQNSA